MERQGVHVAGLDFDLFLLRILSIPSTNLYGRRIGCYGIRIIPMLQSDETIYGKGAKRAVALRNKLRNMQEKGASCLETSISNLKKN